jgi:hypothetical protein
MTRTIAEILAVLAVAGLWYYKTPAPTPVNTWTPAKTAPEVKYIPKEVIKIKEVIVYRDIAKDKLDLPAEIKNDPKIHVATSNIVEPNDRPVNVTTLLNESGEFSTYQKALPHPWFKFEDRKEIIVTQGWRDTQVMTRLTFDWKVLQTKGFYWGATGSVDMDGSKMLGGSVSFRF